MLVLGRFVYSKVKSGLVQKVALAVVLNWAAQVTMTSNRLIIRSCVMWGFKHEPRSQGLSSEERKPVIAAL
jgi:hypothetical protein